MQHYERIARNVNVRYGILYFAGICGTQEQCSIKDISVEQTKTGEIVNGKPEFEVTLFNGCPCNVAMLKFSCKGFKTAEKIDPNVLIVAEEECSLPVGSFITPFSGYVFKYAWNCPCTFNPLFLQPHC